MEMKNKLFRHHKSKFALVVKQFSLTCLGVFAVLSAVAIPTYISTLGNQKVVTQAKEENGKEKQDNKANEDSVENDKDNEEKLLAYE